MFWNGSTAIDGLSGSGRGVGVEIPGGASCNRLAGRRERIRPHRLLDILDLLCAEVGERNRQNLPDLSVCLTGNTNAPRPRQALQPRCNVHPVPEQITPAHHHVTDVDADAEVDALVCRKRCVGLGQRRLRLYRALHGIDGAAELSKHTVARAVRDAPPVVGDGFVEDRAALGEPLERPDLIGAHEP
jgi:hypothetical protein